MDEKTLSTLEFPKILKQLSERTSFSASATLALNLRPTGDIDLARMRLAETAEARRLLVIHPQTSIGGTRDVRPQVEAATRGVILAIPDILDIKATLISARQLARLFDRQEGQFPYLTEIASRLPQPIGLIDAISRVISERGDIQDSASPRLAEIRKELRIVHDRLITRMQRMLTDPKISPYLQDNLVTQRDGRYVIPLRADFKGKVKAVIHDQSSSGATLFVEPLGVVELNNQYRQLQLDERDEERRILADLCGRIAGRADDIFAMIETIAELDLIFARAKYAEDIHAVEPQLKNFIHREDGLHPGSSIRLQGARHPLLESETAVPIDVLLDSKTYSLIITGPNTGGKTVTLKTVGLLVLMAQSGMHIPVEAGSEISVFEDVLADIGDEQSIEQSLSTFSAHITNIIRILGLAKRTSLVLLDELGAGTDPQEGASLARAILTFLLERGITTMVATHYPELKAYALAREGVVNASVEFDVETLKPTYHLIIGLPGSSNALTIAERLGLTREIVDSARSGFSPEELRVENLLAEIHQQRDLIRKTRVDVEKSRSEAAKLREELAARLESIEDERRDILEKARLEAEDRLIELDEELQDIRRKLVRARQPLEVIEDVEEKLIVLEDDVAVPIERHTIKEIPQVDIAEQGVIVRPIRLGDKVHLRSLGSQGVVSAINEEEAEVQIGILRVRTRLSELQPVGQSVQESSPPLQSIDQEHLGSTDLSQLPVSPGIEIDLRGKRVEEALEMLNDYLDTAYLVNMPWVRIIHGKGTGRLRDAVRKFLSNNSQVKSFEPGKDGEGGDGVTVAKFS